MTTWRDSTSEAVQSEIDALVRVSLGVAQERLSTKGSLSQTLVAADLEGNLEIERDVPTAPSDTLTARVYRNPTLFRAVAIMSTDRRPDGEIVSMHVEHCDGLALELTARFDVVGLSGEVAIGRVSSRVVATKVWGATAFETAI